MVHEYFDLRDDGSRVEIHIRTNEHLRDDEPSPTLQCPHQYDSLCVCLTMRDLPEGNGRPMLGSGLGTQQNFTIHQPRFYRYDQAHKFLNYYQNFGAMHLFYPRGRYYTHPANVPGFTSPPMMPRPLEPEHRGEETARVVADVKVEGTSQSSKRKLSPGQHTSTTDSRPRRTRHVEPVRQPTPLRLSPPPHPKYTHSDGNDCHGPYGSWFPDDTPLDSPCFGSGASPMRDNNQDSGTSSLHHLDFDADQLAMKQRETTRINQHFPRFDPPTFAKQRAIDKTNEPWMIG